MDVLTGLLPPWVSVEAACLGAPREWFITPADGDADDEAWEPDPRAAAMCERCPLRVECLQWAIDHDEWGTWAATSRHQRRQLARRYRRRLCPVCHQPGVIDAGDHQICLGCAVSWLAARAHATVG